ncbi:hypothetical protein E4U17_002369 [Claviceps sp. LM77 group G4]|nr:hypothetical protein E4U17_002369 [Claviceps sp. LM77 group G4]
MAPLAIGALPQQGVPDLSQPAPGPTALGTLQHDAEVSRLHAIIAESNAQRIASDAAAAESEARGVASDAAAAQSAALLALVTASTTNAADNAAVPPGEILPPLVLKVAREVAGVASEDVNDIFTSKFEPWNLIRLHPIFGLRPSSRRGYLERGHHGPVRHLEEENA